VTHTLHRFGKKDSLSHDFIVTAMPARGFNDEGCIPKQKTFLRAALEFNPVNIGNAIKGAEHRAAKDLRPTAHWHRDTSPDPQLVIDEVDRPTTVSAVFDDYASMRAFVAKVVEMDLGLSVNISSVPEQAEKCCGECGVVRHSIEYSLGFQGATEKLPDDTTMQLSTMCGHGMVSATFARKMTDWVRSGRRTPEEATKYLARFCVCGSFNPARAEDILQQAARGK
jgi:hypothetical protein